MEWCVRGVDAPRDSGAADDELAFLSIPHRQHLSWPTEFFDSWEPSALLPRKVLRWQLLIVAPPSSFRQHLR